MRLENDHQQSQAAKPRIIRAPLDGPTTHDACFLNHSPATPFGTLQGCHFFQLIDDLHSGALGSPVPGYYGLSTGRCRSESEGIPGGSSYDQDLQDHMGTNLTRDFAEDAQLLLGQCANSNLNGRLDSTGPCSWNATYNGNHLTTQDHHTTIGGNDAFSAPGLVDPNSTSMIESQSIPAMNSITPTVHAPLQPAVQGPLTCPHGCRGTFGRPGEYRRHMRKHANPLFSCTQLGCTMSFYRRDKLNDHLRQKHGIFQPRRARGAATLGGANVSSATGNQV